ncbi:MAG: hypothetical protein ACI4SB_05875, partial [Acutalibacteraceae bacterium]
MLFFLIFSPKLLLTVLTAITAKCIQRKMKMNKGQLIVVSGPSGSGKDTVIGKAMEILGENAFLSVSMTTRCMRGNEQEGVDYYFV